MRLSHILELLGEHRWRNVYAGEREVCPPGAPAISGFSQGRRGIGQPSGHPVRRWSLPAHGHAIAKAIRRRSDEVLLVEEGSLYPALHRLLKRGWIDFEEGASENNRKAKFYRLTAKGRKQLLVETTKWEKLTRAIARVLRPA
jgi:PadR family transcriptional regulator, regulatory protein PadR